MKRIVWFFFIRFYLISSFLLLLVFFSVWLLLLTCLPTPYMFVYVCFGSKSYWKFFPFMSKPHENQIFVFLHFLMPYTCIVYWTPLNCMFGSHNSNPKKTSHIHIQYLAFIEIWLQEQLNNNTILMNDWY